MFNTLMYTKKLEEAGVTREQAEAQMEILAEILEVDVATKNDINNLELQIANLELQISNLDVRFTSEFNSFRTELNSLRTEFKNNMTLLEHRLITKLGTVIVLTLSAFATILKLF